MTATDEAIALATTIAQAAADKLAQDIVLIDVSERLAITDVFVVATGTNERQVEAIAQAAADKLAQDIVLIDVSERLAITDVFVVATGTNERQVEAVVEALEEAARRAGHKPIRREGQRDGRWVLLDYGDVVVHIQHAEERVFYALERLWKDCPFIPFTDVGQAARSGTGE